MKLQFREFSGSVKFPIVTVEIDFPSVVNPANPTAEEQEQIAAYTEISDKMTEARIIIRDAVWKAQALFPASARQNIGFEIKPVF